MVNTCLPENNPGLHLFYVKKAVKHLRLIDNIIDRLGWESSTNLMSLIQSIGEERQKLIDTNPAFKDAREILDEYKQGELKLDEENV